MSHTFYTCSLYHIGFPYFTSKYFKVLNIFLVLLLTLRKMDALLDSYIYYV
jgi:hypothetical protein